MADALQLFLDGWSCLRVSHWLAREHEIDASPERVAVVIANALAFGVVHGRGRADKQHLRALRARLRPRLRPGLARYFVQHGLDGVDLEIVVDMALCVPDTRTAKRLVLTVECVRGRRHRLRRVNDAVAQACPIRPDEPGF